MRSSFLKSAAVRRAGVVLLPAMAFLWAVNVLPAANAQPSSLYVAAGGTDSGNNCEDAATPCATVSYALTQAASGDTIDVSGTIDDTVVVTGSQNLNAVTISGAGAPAGTPAVLDGSGAGTVLAVSEAAVTLDDIAVEQASGTGYGIDLDSAAVTVNSSTLTGNAGPAIENTQGTLTVNNSAITSNGGPGIVDTQSSGTTITSSTISDNAGGGIISDNCMPGSCSVHVSGSIISDNPGGDGIEAASGGSVSNSTISDNGSVGIATGARGGTLTVTGSTVSGNVGTGINAQDGVSLSASTIADNGGGGINVSDGIQVGFAAPILISGNTITTNTGGSGIYACDCNPSSAKVTISDNTISDNTATEGGGINSESFFGATITDNTITGNTATEGGGIYSAALPAGRLSTGATIVANTIAGNFGTSGGGIFYSPVGSPTPSSVGDSIVDANTGGNCAGQALVSQGDNLSDQTCGFTSNGDVDNAGPALGPLQDNGGSTETMLPAPTSPAVGAVANPTTLDGLAVCGANATDQIGQARPYLTGSECTIGAVEEDLGPAQLAFSTQPPASALAGSKFSVKVSVEDAAGNLVSTDNTDTVTLAITTGTGPAGAALSCSADPVTATAGVASFSCSLTAAGSGYTLAATSGSLASATSSALTVNPVKASKLVFTTEPPASAVVGSSIGVAVSVEDTYGNIVTSSGNSVTLTKSAGPSGGLLSCASDPVAANAGVANFNCSLSKTGNSYALKATSTGLTAATSSLFNITTS